MWPYSFCVFQQWLLHDASVLTSADVIAMKTGEAGGLLCLIKEGN